MQIPPLVEHMLRDLETRHGMMRGDMVFRREDGTQSAIRLQSADGLRCRVFEVDPQKQGLGSLPAASLLSDAAYRYWHALSFLRFGEPDAHGIATLYVHFTAWVGFGDGAQPHAAVSLDVMDGWGARARTFVAPRIENERAWAECLANEWQRALEYSDALFAAQQADDAAA
jgi:hypothetical protein